NGTYFLILPCLIFVGTLWLAACTAAPAATAPDCAGDHITILPTATRQADPNLFIPPAPPNGGGVDEYCPTPIPATTLSTQTPEQFVTTEVANLSLDIENQELAAVAVGDDMLAVAWISDGNVYVALSHGGNHFQVRRVDVGSSVAMAFSAANRLHVVYDRMGQVFYRAADQGTHPADTTFITSPGPGHNPQIAIDSRQWAHIVYEADGNIWHAAHQYEFYWNTELVGAGERPFLITGPQRLGVPEFGWRDFALAYVSGNEVQVRLYGITPFLLPGWLSVAAIPVPEAVTGTVRLDATEIEGQLWLVAAWMSERPSTTPATPLYQQPTFAAVNPLAPDQLANPHQIFQGLNAVRWSSETTPFDAGLRQTIAISDTTGTLIVSARGLVETAVPDEMSLRLGLDPTGGDNPDSPSVVWSSAEAPGSFSQFSVSAPAQGSTATIFLRGTLNGSGVAGTAVWDAVSIHSSAGPEPGGTNLDFEGPFITQDSLTVPEGWTAWYQDSGYAPTNGRDAYTVYAAWSEDGGRKRAGPAAIAANIDATGSTTGAIRPGVTPIITAATEPPSVSFFYIYEAGDPPPDSTFLRFGRPYQTQCELGTTNCMDTPGIPLLERNVVRPSHTLLAAPDPFNPNRAVLVWDALQTDNENKDVFATYAVLR
ncbi:MAG: hypothetical protein KC445_12840, partial [Anaerolineales bacterium]|nr:hypothetical protein [Anaerolineales bacterium]